VERRREREKREERREKREENIRALQCTGEE
jgi:hypothetical protein